MTEGESAGRPKALLTVEQQIEHLKSKGVTFELCSEHEAAEYLAGRTYYFKLAAYRVLFDKRVGGSRDGQYVNLDFGHLRALASLDRDLRYALLPLTLDVEHAARTKLMCIVTEREDEDGYSVSRDYMESLNHNERRRREGEVAMLREDVYSSNLVRKYGKPSDMPMWVLMEVVSFGTLIDMYLYCAERWNDKDMRHEHYMLRQSKSVRNACAHSSNILNGITGVDASISTDAAVYKALAESGFSHRVRTSRMKNPRIRQIVTLLYLHTRFVTNGSGKTRAKESLRALGGGLTHMLGIVPSNDALRAQLGFLSSVIDRWF